MYEYIDCISSYGNNRLIKFDISPTGGGCVILVGTLVLADLNKEAKWQK